MISRRSIIKGVMLSPLLWWAEKKRMLAAAAHPFAGLIYTAANPGKWSSVVATHKPLVSVAKNKVTVTTPHTMTQGHYIVRHTLVLENGTVAGERTYFPQQDTKASATFEIPAGYKGKCFATSFCNLHDFWMEEIML